MADRQRFVEQPVLRRGYRIRRTERAAFPGQRRGRPEARDAACEGRSVILKAKIFPLHGVERRILHFFSPPLSAAGAGARLMGLQVAESGQDCKNISRTQYRMKGSPLRPFEAKGSEKAVTVDSLRTNRVFAILAMLLALVFAGSNLSSAIDRIQHAPGAALEHEHLAFSSLSTADHDSDHHAPPPQGDDSSDHMMGGHHHHADGGSPLLALSSAPAVRLSAAQAAYVPESTDPPPRLTLLGPERPPKSSHMIA